MGAANGLELLPVLPKAFEVPEVFPNIFEVCVEFGVAVTLPKGDEVTAVALFPKAEKADGTGAAVLFTLSGVSDGFPNGEDAGSAGLNADVAGAPNENFGAVAEAVVAEDAGAAGVDAGACGVEVEPNVKGEAAGVAFGGSTIVAPGCVKDGAGVVAGFAPNPKLNFGVVELPVVVLSACFAVGSVAAFGALNENGEGVGVEDPVAVGFVVEAGAEGTFDPLGVTAAFFDTAPKGEGTVSEVLVETGVNPDEAVDGLLVCPALFTPKEKIGPADGAVAPEAAGFANGLAAAEGLAISGAWFPLVEVAGVDVAAVTDPVAGALEPGPKGNKGLFAVPDDDD